MKLKKQTPAATPVNHNNKPSRFKEILTSGLPTMVIWNLLFILTCIPIITIGPSMAAMGFCMNSLVEGDEVKKRCCQDLFQCIPCKFYESTSGRHLLFVYHHLVRRRILCILLSQSGKCSICVHVFHLHGCTVPFLGIHDAYVPADV